MTTMTSTLRSTVASTMDEPISNRRQPVRQTRINPSRSHHHHHHHGSGRALASANSLTSATADDALSRPPGFFPGITYFADALSALPKEMIHHYSMLKEVDVKIFGPEEALRKLISTAPPAPSSSSATEYPNPEDAANLARRQHYLQMRYVMSDMLASLDEKNHALAVANDSLDRLHRRFGSAWPHIEQEISEEARWGNPHHWAYTDKSITEKKPVTAERTRREVALANSIAATAAQDADPRGKGSGRRGQAQHVDSDADDLRPGRKTTGTGKRGKPAEFSATSNGAVNNTGTHKRRRIEKPGIAAIAGGNTMERSLSAALNTNPRARGSSPRESAPVEPARKRTRGGGAAGGPGRRRAGTVNSNVNSPSLASSPLVGTFAASKTGGQSPALGNTSMQRTSSSRNQTSVHPASTHPIPNASSTYEQANGSHAQVGAVDMDRRATSKPGSETRSGRANADESATTDWRVGRPTTSRGTERAIKREESAASTVRQRPPSVSTSSRTGVNGGSNANSNGNANASTQGNGNTSSAGNGSNNNNGINNGNGNGKASKTTTPVAAAFEAPPPPPPAPPRSSRGQPTSGNTSNSNSNHTSAANSTTNEYPAPPAKRSHKKGAGIQAQMAAAAAQAAAGPTSGNGANTSTAVTKPSPSDRVDARNNQEPSNHAPGSRGEGSQRKPPEDDDDDDDDEDLEGEPRYCYCNRVSYGHMIACDMPDCEKEWFHLECAGLTKAPTAKTKWYCNDCKRKMRT